MDVTPGLDPMAEVRSMEVMIGNERQFVLFTGRGTALSWHRKTTDRQRPAAGARGGGYAWKRTSHAGLYGHAEPSSIFAAESQPDRAGYVLVLFVMMFLGLLGLAALVIDLGFARLTQRQMQTAVDSAALEGLRWQVSQQCRICRRRGLLIRTSRTKWGLSDRVAEPATKRQVRRWAASQVVADGPVGNGSQAQPSMFADYVDTSGGTVHYGAGPVVNFSGGVGPTDLAAAQTMTLPSPPVYQPRGPMARRGWNSILPMRPKATWLPARMASMRATIRPSWRMRTRTTIAAISRPLPARPHPRPRVSGPHAAYQ